MIYLTSIGKNPFKDGPLASIISQTRHQEFFQKDFKINSLDRRLDNLNEKEKLDLLDRVIERFMEVDLEKQNHILGNRLRSKWQFECTTIIK